MPSKMKSPCSFTDRAAAAVALAAALQRYRGRNPLILAIPRGAVPMGRIIAEQLGGELDVVLVHKLSDPFNPEFAIGAIDETGWAYLAPYAADIPDATTSYLAQEKRHQLDVLQRRRVQYTHLKQPIDPSGRITIVIDDGLATGATMIAALHATRAKNPAKLICAIPVAPPETLAVIKPLADTVVCLCAPDNFMAVGQFYGTFPQVDDREVMQALGAPSLD
jgi:predicted phosphoribosyltransferase